MRNDCIIMYNTKQVHFSGVYRTMIKIISWEQAISACKYDEQVGIKIAKLAGDADFSTFITIIDSHKSVNPHYHAHGDEHYHIISGIGEIKLVDTLNGTKTSHIVKSGESFVVPEKIEHQLVNVGHEQLVLMFSCPISHLDSDRYFV